MPQVCPYRVGQKPGREGKMEETRLLGPVAVV